MDGVYLDNAATTRVSQESAQAAVDAMLLHWGNPSSRHSLGIDAERLVNDARRAVAAELRCRDDEIYFTSGGTEANNTAVLGAAHAKRRTGNRVIISSVEHSSVLEAAAQLESEGFDVVRVSPHSDGTIHLEDIDEALTGDTVLVSFMVVNNETGAYTDPSAIAKLLKRKKSSALFHCDAVQAFGKIPLDVGRIGCDLLSLSGHKIHAPKGVGALYCRKGVRITPLHFGGNQQNKVRPGTEPVPLIAALGAAVKALPPKDSRQETAAQLNSLCRKLLLSERIQSLAPVVINSPEGASPHILSFATGCIKSETMLNYLSERKIYVSSGSACAKGKASHVLTASGLSAHIADSTIRVSFCDDNTPTDVEALVSAVGDALRTLVRFR